MAMLVLIAKDILKYQQPETGEWVVCRGWGTLVSKVRDHRRRHGLPIPLNYEQKLLEDYCVARPQDCGQITETSTPTYPPLGQQAVSLARDLGKWIKAGFPRTDRALAAKRLSVCVNCEFWSGRLQMDSMRCLKCGCRMRIKVGMRTAQCPIGKW